MLLNAYAVLDLFLTAVRLGLGVAVLWLGLSTWWRWRGAADPERRGPLEARSYYLFLAAGVLCLLSLASWPLFYLLLQSYVPQWPGVMCIYGVTQIGVDSEGPARFLPRLVAALQLLKPALVFVAGAWFVLYLVNRRTRTAPLMPRVLLAALLLGLTAVADTTAEGAYVTIPKKEEFPSAGCCTGGAGTRSEAPDWVVHVMPGARHGPWLYGLYFGVNLAMCAGLALYTYRLGGPWYGAALLPLAVGAAVSPAVNLAFLTEAAAPTLLHLPHHHCPYDLIPLVPESIVAVAFFVLGCCMTGWACVAGWLGRCDETRPFLGAQVRDLLWLGLVGYAASVAMLSLELVLA